MTKCLVKKPTGFSNTKATSTFFILPGMYKQFHRNIHDLRPVQTNSTCWHNITQHCWDGVSWCWL